jgi:hypothetical protein
MVPSTEKETPRGPSPPLPPTVEAFAWNTIPATHSRPMTGACTPPQPRHLGLEKLGTARGATMETPASTHQPPTPPPRHHETNITVEGGKKKHHHLVDVCCPHAATTRRPQPGIATASHDHCQLATANHNCRPPQPATVDPGYRASGSTLRHHTDRRRHRRSMPPATTTGDVRVGHGRYRRHPTPVIAPPRTATHSHCAATRSSRDTAGSGSNSLHLRGWTAPDDELPQGTRWPRPSKTAGEEGGRPRHHHPHGLRELRRQLGFC